MKSYPVKLVRRTASGKGGARALRRKGLVPAVLYGEGGENIAVGGDPRELVKVLLSPTGRNTVLEVELEGEAKHFAIVRDYQVHPFKRKLLHVDLLRVTEQTQLVVDIPLKLSGKSAGEQKGAKLLQVARTLRVRCTAGNIPTEIAIDVTPYDIGESLYSTAVPLPDGVEGAFRNHFPIFSVSQLRAATAEEEEGEEDGEDAAEAAES